MPARRPAFFARAPLSPRGCTSRGRSRVDRRRRRWQPFERAASEATNMLSLLGRQLDRVVGPGERRRRRARRSRRHGGALRATKEEEEEPEAALTKKKSVTIQAPTQPPLSSQPSCSRQSLPSARGRAQGDGRAVARSDPGATARRLRRDEQFASRRRALREAPTSVQAADRRRRRRRDAGTRRRQVRPARTTAAQAAAARGRADRRRLRPRVRRAADDLEAVHARQKLRRRRQPSAAAVVGSVSFAADIVRGAPCATAAAAAAAELARRRRRRR